MSEIQKVIKYLAIAFAIFLSVNIIGGIVTALFFGLSIFGFVTERQEQKGSQSISSQKIEMIQNSEEIENLKIEIGYSKLIIKTGEKLDIEAKNRDNTLEVKKEKDTLIVKDNKAWNLLNQYEESEIIITMPKNNFLNKVKIEAGSGEVSISDIKMSQLDFEVGAGNSNISNIVVENKARIEGGAGKVVIQDSILNDLDLDVGVGEFQINHTAVYGNSDIDAGIGKLDIKLKGTLHDYSIRGSRGLGSFTIENKEVEDDKIYGDGEHRIKIDAGVGKVGIDFGE